jgi:hypothetical protein
MTNGTAAGTLSAGRDIVPFVTGRTEDLWSGRCETGFSEIWLPVALGLNPWPGSVRDADYTASDPLAGKWMTW